jgi:hypothetical protein
MRKYKVCEHTPVSIKEITYIRRWKKIRAALKYFHGYHFDKSYFRDVYIFQLINGYVYIHKVVFLIYIYIYTFYLKSPIPNQILWDMGEAGQLASLLGWPGAALRSVGSPGTVLEDARSPGAALEAAGSTGCWRCILLHQTYSLHFGLDLIMELTRH